MAATFDADPAVGEAVDRLALTVLQPGVPVPAHDYGDAGNIYKPASLAFFPHVRRRELRVDGAGVGAISPLLNADWLSTEPAPAPTPGSTAVSLVLPLRCVVTVGCTTFLPPRALILPPV